MDNLSLSQGFGIHSSQTFVGDASTFGDFSYFGKDRAETLTFQDYGATQDNLLSFTDFEPAASQNLNWNNGLPSKQVENDLSEKLTSLSLEVPKSSFEQFAAGFDEDEENVSQQELPPHACAYCQVSNPACVVKCLSTGKWFCNGQVSGRASCIIMHLVKSKYKEVQLHKDGPLGDSVLECYATGSRNVFVLGFVPVKSENTVVLLARDVPANHAAIKDLNLDTSQWHPVVEDKALVSWLVKRPTAQELARARTLTVGQVGKLEELWKTAPEAGVGDIEQRGQREQKVQPAPLKYDDSAQYQAIFEPLVKLEADYDKAMKENQGREGVTVRWDWGLNQRRVAYFFFPRDDNELRLMPGDELRLGHKAPGGRAAWTGIGNVMTYQQSEEVCLEMQAMDVPDDCSSGFYVEFVWKGTSYERMRNALNIFRKYDASISGHLYHVILGHEVEPATLKTPVPQKSLDVPNLPELNHSQIHAVRSVLQQPLSLIQGPPGTGKTVTSAAIVYHLCQGRTCQVLVAAPSNVAVDQLASRIDGTGLKVVRLCAKSRETVASPVEHLTLHYQVTHMQVPEGEKIRKLLQLRADKGGLTASDEKELRTLRRRLEMEILENADVVCSTCVGAGDPRLNNFRFQHVLIDESTQAAEPECIIPMVLGAKQVVLVGDHCQLGPVIMCKGAAAAGLSQSLFERLRLLGVKPIRLQVQYRMHPCLSLFPSNTFYEGALQNGTGMGDRILKGVDFPWPNADKPLMFWTQLGAEELSASGTSYLNRTEATNVERAVTRFLQSGLQPHQIGVITPYEGQRAHVVATLLRNGVLRQDLYKEIEVSSVDAFQGREKDIIVLSCVRSNEQQSIGFLSDPRRLNVALTRARFGLVILGNPRVLSKQPLWNSLLSYFKECDAMVEGPLTHLKPSLVQLHRPLKAFDRSSFGIGSLTGRYQPPERAGDPLPPRLPPSGRPTMMASTSTTQVSLSAAAAGGPAVSLSLSSASASASNLNFMPFSSATYAIPAPPPSRATKTTKLESSSRDDGDLAASQSTSFRTEIGGGDASATQQSETFELTKFSQPGGGAFDFTAGFTADTTFDAGLLSLADIGTQQVDGFLLSQGFNGSQFLNPGTDDMYGAGLATQDKL